MAGWRTWGLQMYNQEVRMEMGVGREVQDGEKEEGEGLGGAEESGLVNNGFALAW